MRQLRGIPGTFETREEGGEHYIEGYFAVYNSNYEIADGMSESIAPGAFEGSLGGDVRALVNHDTTLVLGRTAAHTLELRDDSHGLWGRVSVNPKDGSAMDALARVERGDVSQCSIGFDILSEETDFRDDGSVHWTIREAKLWEVSVCTFPAYQETNISARADEKKTLIERRTDAWREAQMTKLKGGANGA